MSSYFAQVIKQAKKTTDPKNVSSFLQNFLVLKHLVDKLTASDINIDSCILKKENYTTQSTQAPCTFVHIYENEHVSISVFVLADSYTMPIHDHPRIYGLLKPISGKLHVQSYTASASVDGLPLQLPYQQFRQHPLRQMGQDDLGNVKCQSSSLTPVIMEPLKELTIDSECAILTPTESNYHEIKAVDGPAAFFDVLSPPYESKIPIYGSRKCSFYRKIESNNNDDLKSQIYLQKISCPKHYYCENGYYEPPEFLCNE